MLKCQLCGTPLKAAQAIITPKEEDYIITCPPHTQLFGTCRLCLQSSTCAFETGPSKKPKAVIKEVRHGNMVQQIQIKNPERVAETCQKGCKCYDTELECLRDFGTCGNYDEIPLAQSKSR